jgi:hypothetical protein
MGRPKPFPGLQEPAPVAIFPRSLEFAGPGLRGGTLGQGVKQVLKPEP